MQISKIEAARRQLLTSVRLLFEDADSVSVYTLAHASWEVLDALCKHQGRTRFRAQMAGATGRPESEIKAIANFGKNHFKHADLDPEAGLDGFSDDLNDHVIFAAIMDYGTLASTKPMEVQLYPLWYFAVYPEKLQLPAMQQIKGASDQMFPSLATLTRDRQKAAGLSAMLQALNHKGLMMDLSTDRTPVRAIVPGKTGG